MTVQELNQLAQEFNRIYFDGELLVPPVTTSRKMTRTLGFYYAPWKGKPHRIKISSRCQHPLSILLHELIHAWQFQNHLPLGHGHTFREKAAALGAVPGRSSTPKQREGYEKVIALTLEQHLRIQPLGQLSLFQT